MSHLKPHADYKPTDKDWLGRVPTHWTVAPLKRLLEIQNGADHKSIETDDGVPVYGSGGAFAFAKTHLYDGESILLGRKGTIDKPLFVSGKFWTVDTMYWTKIRPPAVPKYAYYLALTVPFDRYSTNTALPSMTKEALNAHIVAYPPVGEQARIAGELDKFTKRIDTLIEKKTCFIELLKEKRLALITRAVTKGLNPDALMKDSGIEWLGEVPAHWAVARVKYVTRRESGHTPDKKNPLFWENCNIPWVSLKDTKALRSLDYIRDTHTYINELGLQGSSARILPAKTVVFTRDASVGLCAITERPMAVSQHLVGWVQTGKVDPEYLLRVFEAMSSWLVSLTAGATIQTIGMDDIGTLATPVPSIEEQLEIVKSIEKAKATITRLICLTEQSISLLKERRSALITAAVTGKIDLRAAA